MDSKHWQRWIWWLLVLVHCAIAQVPSPPSTIITVTLTLTEALWPLKTITATEAGGTITYTGSETTATFTAIATTVIQTQSDDIELSTTITASGATATYLGFSYNGLDTEHVEVVPAYNISLYDWESLGFCYYPTSGQWSLLPRILFYVTIVFALVARRHEWLVGGALTAALVYSSLAAFQMSFQVWSGSALAELDFLPVMGILGISCILAVPLMNWSSTIQRMGLGEENTSSHTGKHMGSKSKKRDYGTARIVLVLWSLVVAIGFLSGFVRYLKPDGSYSMAIMVDTGVSSCVPPDGFLDITAGQLPFWQAFRFTSEFAEQNNCINPCSTYAEQATLFRSPDELHLASMQDIAHYSDMFESFDAPHQQDGDHWAGLSKNRESIQFVFFFEGFMMFLLPFILLQGVLHLSIFWRSTPQKARWKIYRGLLAFRNIKMDGNTKSTAWTRFAFSIAWIFYGFALFVLVVTPLVFLITLIVTELAMYWTPQSESNSHVDQWGVYAVTIMIVIAAIISRVAPKARTTIRQENVRRKLQFYDQQWQQLQQERPRTMNVMPRYQKLSVFKQVVIFYRQFIKFGPSGSVSLRNQIRHIAAEWRLRMRYEWNLTCRFWKKPYLKPERRKDAGDVWNDKSIEDETIDEQNDRYEEAEKWQQKETEAAVAKAQFVELWNWMASQNPQLVSPQVSAAEDAPGHSDIRPSITAHHETNANTRQTGQGIADSIPLLSTHTYASQRSRGPLVSSIETVHDDGTVASPRHPALQRRSAQQLERHLRRHSPEMATMSNSDPIISQPVATDIHYQHRVAAADFRLSPHQISTAQLQRLAPTIPRKPMAQDPVEAQLSPDHHTLEALQWPATLNPHTSSVLQLEPQRGRAGDESRDTDAHHVNSTSQYLSRSAES